MKILRMMFGLLDGRERKQLAGIAVGMLLIGILQAGGVASVLPFMQLVSNPGLLEGDGWPGRLYDRIGFASPEGALLAAGVVMLGVIALNNTLNALGVWAIARWAWGLDHRLSTTLLSRYLNRPYPFFLGRSTTEMNRTVLDEVGSVVTGVVLPVVLVATQSLVALLIVVLLAIVDANMALLLASTLGGGYAVVYAFVQRGQRSIGQERFRENGRRFKIAGEALSGIKDVKTLGREDEFVRRFADPSRRFARAAAMSQMVAQVPRYALETIGFGTIVLIVLVNLRNGSDMTRLLPVLSLYAFAAYRLMPAIAAIFAGLLAIRFSSPALDVLHEDLAEAAQPPPAARSGDSPGIPEVGQLERIELRGVGFRYPGASTQSLTDVDLSVDARRMVGFVGPTGVGKTTLVDIVLGLLRPSQGEILVNGVALDAASAGAWRGRCGYVPQDVFLADDTVTANIAFGVPEEDIDGTAVQAAAEAAQLHAFVKALPAGYDTLVGARGVRMSGGERQRIGIARALYTNPELLVLDEATSALDGVTESAVIDTIRELVHHKTILVIAHRLTTVRECDVIYVLEDGRVTGRGTHQELLRDHQGFRAMAGKGRGRVTPSAAPR